jgi:hypothetical protein
MKNHLFDDETTIASIMEFREKNPENLSTSHTMTMDNFIAIEVDLFAHFFEIDIEIRGDNVKVTIPL